MGEDRVALRVCTFQGLQNLPLFAARRRATSMRPASMSRCPSPTVPPSSSPHWPRANMILSIPPRTMW